MKAVLRTLICVLLLAVTAQAELKLRKSTAGQEVPLGYFTDSVDGNTEETGLTIANTDIKLWKEGATSLVSKNSGGAISMSSTGVYYCTLDATDTNTVGNLVIFCHPTGAGPIRVECYVQHPFAWDAERAGVQGMSLVYSTVASVTSQTDLILNTTVLSSNLVGGRIIIRQASTNKPITGTVASTTAGEEVTFTVDGTADFTIAANDVVEIVPPSFSISKLLATTNGAATVATQLAHLDMDSSDISGGGVLTDSDFENVPDARTWKLILNANNELVGDKTLVLDNDTGEKTFAVNFATDLAINGKINTVDSVTIDTGTALGVTFGTSGRERNLAKVRITGVTAGTYTIAVEVTDGEGNPHTGLVTLKVVD